MPNRPRCVSPLRSHRERAADRLAAIHAEIAKILRQFPELERGRPHRAGPAIALADPPPRSARDRPTTAAIMRRIAH